MHVRHVSRIHFDRDFRTFQLGVALILDLSLSGACSEAGVESLETLQSALRWYRLVKAVLAVDLAHLSHLEG